MWSNESGRPKPKNNPTGLCMLAQGWTQSVLPWDKQNQQTINPERVVSEMARRMMQPLQGWVNSFSRPRVAQKTAQPWANIHNPVGVHIHVPHLPSKRMRTRAKMCHPHFRATMKIPSNSHARPSSLHSPFSILHFSFSIFHFPFTASPFRAVRSSLPLPRIGKRSTA